MMSKKATCLLAATLLLGVFVACGSSAPKVGFGEGEANVPVLPKAERPSIPERETNITSHGGVGNGVFMNTAAFEAAIASLSDKGGGRLVVPAGVWLSGPIVLKSNIELHLTEDAILVFSTDRDLYPVVATIFEGRDTYRCQSPLSAIGATNIAITGKGIIDGSGDAWRAVKRDKISPSDWKKIVSSGGIVSEDNKTWYPTENFMKGAGDADQNISNWAKTKEDFESIRDFLRPVMLFIRDCDRVLVEGVIVLDSPCWNIHMVMSKNIMVDGITVRCPWYAQNGDGIDIESCDVVEVRNSTFDVGDDAICIKSGKDEDGRKRGVPCSNITVDNCVVFHGHGGFVVGSEMSGGVKNVVVTNCRFSGTDVGLRFKSNRGRGGVVENIYIKDIVMNDIATEALLFDLFYSGRSALEVLDQGGDDGEENTNVAAMPADETTPQFRNIYISDVVCRGARRAMYFNGLPEMNVTNVVVENTTIEAKIGAKINESTDVVLRNVTIVAQEGPALIINNVTNLKIEQFDFQMNPDQKIALEVTGRRNNNIMIYSKGLDEGNSSVGRSASDAVRFEEVPAGTPN